MCAIVKNAGPVAAVALALALIVVVAVAVACSGEGIAAPHVIGAREDTGCPSADQALAHARGALGIDGRGSDDDVLGGLREVVRAVLVDEGGLRILIQGAAVLLADGSRITLDRFLSGIDPGSGLGGLTPHTTEVLRYIDGSSVHAQGAHPETLAALHEIVDTCDAASTLSTLRILLELEVSDGVDGPALAPPGQGERSFLAALLESAQRAVEEPALQEVLDTIELADPADPADPSDPAGTGTIRVGKEAFALLARLLGANLAAPDFDPTYTRSLLDEVILLRISDDAARAKVDAMLDLLLLLTEPDAAVFPQVQSLVGCVHGADPGAALPSLVYDWLTIEGLSVDAFLADVATATDTVSADELRLALIDVIGALEAAPVVANDLASVLARFLEADHAALLVKTMLRLQGRGVVTELARLTFAIEECHPRAPGSALP